MMNLKSHRSTSDRRFRRSSSPNTNQGDDTPEQKDLNDDAKAIFRRTSLRPSTPASTQPSFLSDLPPLSTPDNRRQRSHGLSQPAFGTPSPLLPGRKGRNQLPAVVPDHNENRGTSSSSSSRQSKRRKYVDSVRFYLEGQYSGEYSVDIDKRAAMHSTFLRALITTLLGPRNTSENKKVFTIQRQIEKRDMRIVVFYLELKANEEYMSYPSLNNFATLKKMIMSNRAASEYYTLIGHANFLGMMQLTQLIENVKHEAGFFTKPCRERKEIRRRSVKGSRGLKMVERVTGSELTISIGPCKTCKLGCDMPHECSIAPTSAVYLNRALQQKQLEIRHVGNIVSTNYYPETHRCCMLL
mmetsp:Transcript_25754/g.41379  ORF Transcript_25754/g.41379 Transcript_25754/m.41379 type:complete len:355 (+) Transcript_25754:170-1234(+)